MDSIRKKLFSVVFSENHAFWKRSVVMGLDIESILRDVESEYSRMVDEVRRGVLERLRLKDKKKHSTIYLCLDSGRVYLSRPKKCNSFKEVGIDEYVDSATESELRLARVRLEGWRWLLSSCRDVLSKIATSFYSGSRTLYFDGGSVHVMGVERPLIVVSVAKCTEGVAELLKRLAHSPYRVEVFVAQGLKPLGPEEALKTMDCGALPSSP